MYTIKKTVTKLIYVENDLDFKESYTTTIASYPNLSEALTQLQKYSQNIQVEHDCIFTTDYYIEFDNLIIFPK